jgi:hypothetical protein
MSLKIKTILIHILIIAILSSVCSSSYADSLSNHNYNDDLLSILYDIETTENKTLIIDEIIGDKHVKYWEHNIDDIFVKNDSILLHVDAKTGELLYYEKHWTDIKIDPPDFNDDTFEENSYYWKKKIVFPDMEDCSYFYTFHESQNFPVICLEIRHIDGTTIIYDPKGSEIGRGVPAPSEKGFSLSGSDDEGGDDYWHRWRINADFWFNQWCDSAVSIGSPSVNQISNYIKDQNVTFFYEIAHSKGLSTRFQNNNSSYYYASQLKKDIANRQPMKFSFIASCDGMSNTGLGTLSYEFRKGHINGTVTVGYDGMAWCPGWSDSFEWQNKLFTEMNNGLTVKHSFDEARSMYPLIAKCVRLVGDENIVIGNNPPIRPDKPFGPQICKINVKHSFNTKTFDPEGDPIYYLFDWGDGSDSGWIGPIESNQEFYANHSWSSLQEFEIKVKVKDENGAESNWSDSFKITISLAKSSKLSNLHLFEKLFFQFPKLKLLLQHPVFKFLSQ